MSTKYFIFGERELPSKETIRRIQTDREMLLRNGDEREDEYAASQLSEDDCLVHTDGRILVKLDIKNKEKYRFESGIEIRRERKFNQFNLRIANPVNCTVISGDNLPKNAEMLVDHNAFHESNRINDYKNSFENEGSDRVRYFSVPLYECYAWRFGKEDWKPMPTFEFALRVFKPYKGLIAGIEPTVLKDTLYVTSGEYAGNVVKTLKGCDYQIVYASDDGREGNLIVFRPNGNEKRNMPEEAIAILHEETEKVNAGDYLVGYEISDAKKLNNAD